MIEKNTKKTYVKPVIEVYHLKMRSLICTSPDPLFYLGGGGSYSNDDIINNGDDY